MDELVGDSTSESDFEFLGTIHQTKKHPHPHLMCFETCLKSRFNLLTSVANVGAMSCSYTLGLWSRSSTVELVDHLLLELDLDLEAVQNTEHLHTNL